MNNSKIKFVIFFFIFNFTAIFPEIASAYCYGKQRIQPIIKDITIAGDFFNSVKIENAVKIPGGTTGFSMWSNQDGNFPMWLYMTVPEKIKITSPTGHTVNISVAINNGYTAIPGYHTIRSGSLPDGWCTIPDHRIYRKGRSVGSNITIIITANEGLHSGTYTGRIPFLHTYSVMSDEQTHWANFNKLTSYGATGFIPVTLKVQNRCQADSHNVEMNYGTVSPDQIKNKSIKAVVTMSCRYPANLKYTISGVNGSQKNSASCGTGNECYLFINKDGVRSTDGQFEVKAEEKVSLAIESEFRFKSDFVQEGKFHGSGILKLNIE